MVAAFLYAVVSAVVVFKAVIVCSIDSSSSSRKRVRRSRSVEVRVAVVAVAVVAVQKLSGITTRSQKNYLVNIFLYITTYKNKSPFSLLHGQYMQRGMPYQDYCERGRSLWRM